MARTEIVLDAAAFLDSPQAQTLDAGLKDVRRVIEAFLAVCYQDLGKKPRFLDGHDVHQGLGHLLPGRLLPKDPVAESVPKILTAFFDHLEATEVVNESFEIRQSLAATIPEFLQTVRTGKNVHHHHGEPKDPFVHGAPKVGRNDPCSCGSGKKFKKCHGKEA